VNADLDWFNQDLDDWVDPTGDHTDASGHFACDIPAGRYDVYVLGPPGGTLAAVLLESLDLDVPQTLPPTVLPQGALLSAHVQNEAGAALSGKPFEFVDVTSGDVVYVHNATTDAFGDIESLVPLGAYDISVSDGTGILAPEWREDYTVSSPASLGTIVMRTGRTVTGRLVDQGSTGVFNVDIDVIDETTGLKRYTPVDNTDFAGNYSVFIPNGTYELRFTPSPGSPFAPDHLLHVVITGNRNLGTFVLRPALTITGTVRNHLGQNLVNADIDVVDIATGNKLYTPNDNTGAAGAFAIIVPAGFYDFTFDPPVGFDLASGVLWNRNITSSQSLGVITLSPGALVTGTVTGEGSPLSGADLDFVDATIGREYPTPTDDTDGGGFYRVRVAAGTYHVTASPPAGAPYQAETLSNRSIGSDTVIDFDLAGVVTVGNIAVPPARLAIVSVPNPFVRSTRIRLELPSGVEATTWSAEIVDVVGRLVRSFGAIEGTTASTQTLLWDGADDRGVLVAPGRYFVHVTGPGFQQAHAITRTN